MHAYIINKNILSSRAYLEAFEFDELLYSINDENFIVIIHITHVTSVKPALRVYGGCRSRSIIQISW